MSDFQTLRQMIQEEYRELVVFIVTGTKADEETIDRLIETGDSEQIFQKDIQEKGVKEGRLLLNDWLVIITMKKVFQNHFY